MDRNIVTSMKPDMGFALANILHAVLTEHDPAGAGAERGDEVEAESPVGAAVLQRDGHHEASHEHHVGRLHTAQSLRSL